MNRRALWLLRGAGLVLLGWLLSRAEWYQIRTMIDRIDARQLLFLPLFTVLVLGLRAWRWRLLLGVQNITFSLPRALG